MSQKSREKKVLIKLTKKLRQATKKANQSLDQALQTIENLRSERSKGTPTGSPTAKGGGSPSPCFRPPKGG